MLKFNYVIFYAFRQYDSISHSSEYIIQINLTFSDFGFKFSTFFSIAGDC